MIPLRVALKGFMCYGERQVLDFSGAPLWVLAGANGTGKSTVFNAVTFALYGAFLGGEVKLNELINHRCNGADVEFDFQLGPHCYRVKRTIHQKGASTVAAFRLDGGGQPVAIPDTTSAVGFKRWVEEQIGLSREAFVSCVLLRQGEADTLLQKAPAERFKILSSLIDLSRYQRLFAEIDSERKQLNAEVKLRRGQLAAMPKPTDTDIAAAEEAFDTAWNALTAAQQKVTRMAGLVEQARQWEKLSQQLADCDADIVATRKILGNALEIKQRAARRRELDAALPRVQAIVDHRARVVELTAKSEELEKAQASLNHSVETARQDLQVASVGREEASQERERLRDALQETRDLAAAAKELAEKLDQLEQHEATLTDLRGQLAGYPEDLDKQIAAVTRRVEELSRLREVLPSLRAIAANRDKLSEGVETLREAESRVQDAETQQAEAARALTAATVAVGEAEERERAANDVFQTFNTQLQSATEALTRFQDAAQEPTCSLCGQPITPEHAAAEIIRLRATVQQLAQEVTDATARHEHKRAGLQQARDAENAARQAVDAARAGLTEAKNRLKTTREQQDSRFGDLASHWKQLAPPFQSRIAAQAPETVEDWLATTWPSANELAALGEEAENIKAVQEGQSALQKQHTARAGIVGQCANAEKTVHALSATLDRVAAEQARAELPVLTARTTVLADDENTAASRFKQADGNLTDASAHLSSLQDELSKAALELATIRTSQSEVETALTSERQHLNDDWRVAAERATEADIEAWCVEQAGLADALTAEEQLSGAHGRLDALEQQARGIREQLVEIPAEAQLRPSVVEAALNEAKDAQQRATTEHGETQTALAQLNQQREDRETATSDLRRVERDQHLHERLATLLGKNGLQAALLRRAERSIVSEANHILDQLSGGRMRLELRNANDAAEKALDLLYYDALTTTASIPIGLASGSQRFRIAVSLALAIGRYLSHESERIQSVIIDEGFGSLDQTGRGDMVAVLQDLQTVLQRIILVSHQEEIAESFPNRYDVRLVNGTSVVELAGGL